MYSPGACLTVSQHGLFTVYTGSGVRRAKGTTWTFPLLPSCYVCRLLCVVRAHLWSRLVMRIPSQLPASVWANPGHWAEAFIALKEFKDELGRERWNGIRERAVVVLGVESEASDCISPGLQLVSCRQAASHEAAENPMGCLDPKRECVPPSACPCSLISK